MSSKDNNTSSGLHGALGSNGYSNSGNTYHNQDTGKTIHTDGQYYKETNGQWKKHMNGNSAG